MSEQNVEMTGYPSIDKPWLKYYGEKTYDYKASACTMYDMLYNHNKDYKNETALNYYDRKITFGEMFEEIHKAEKAYWAAGIREKDVVIVCSVNMPETVYTLYALNHIGAVVNLVDPRTNKSAFREYINECGAKLIVTVDLVYPVVQSAVDNTTVSQVIVVSPSISLPVVKKIAYRIKNKKTTLNSNAIDWNTFIEKGRNASPQFATFVKEKCSIMAHTGGTTGLPKAVMLSDENMNSVAQAYNYVGIPFERKQKFFNDLPPFIVYGLSIAVHAALCLGLQVILYPVFDSKGFPKLFAHYKPNHFCALTDHLKYLSQDKHSDIDFSFLICPVVGGDSLNVELEKNVNDFLKKHGCKYEVLKGYGMTELAATVVTAFPGANALGSVGVPLLMNNVKIVDTDNGQELPFNQTGEIWISGPSIMLGYLNNREATDELIVTDENGEKWVRTGDLGHIDENGLLFHEGRLRRIYLTAVEGQPAKIFPMTIEKAIKESDKVADCTVVGRFKKDSAYYESVAFIIKKQDIEDSLIVKELESICSNEVPSYMRPVEYRFIDEMPHTPIGKVDFRKLEDICKNKE